MKKAASLMMTAVFAALLLCSCGGEASSVAPSSGSAGTGASSLPASSLGPAPEGAEGLAQAIAAQQPLDLAAGEILLDADVNLWAPLASLPEDRFDPELAPGEFARGPGVAFAGLNFEDVGYQYHYMADHLRMITYSAQTDTALYDDILALFVAAYGEPVHEDENELSGTRIYHWDTSMSGSDMTTDHTKDYVVLSLELSGLGDDLGWATAGYTAFIGQEDNSQPDASVPDTSEPDSSQASA